MDNNLRKIANEITSIENEAERANDGMLDLAIAGWRDTAERCKRQSWIICVLAAAFIAAAGAAVWFASRLMLG